MKIGARLRGSVAFVVLSLVAVPLATPTASAQCEPKWTQVTSATAPPARYGSALAYDIARGLVVVFGGIGSDGYLSDTWEWDGVSWTQRTPPTSPPACFAPVASYDVIRGVTVLFGGWNGSSFLGGTWEWDGANWTQRTSVAAPLARNNHAMIYDTARQTTVLLGGSNGSGPLGDIWEYVAPLRLLQGPVDTTVAEGSDAAFGVTAIGSACIRYQWRKNGVPIPGTDKAFFRIPSADRADAGTYDVVVRASCGQMVSEVATLTVAVRADFDFDWDVDLDDFAIFQKGGSRLAPPLSYLLKWHQS